MYVLLGVKGEEWQVENKRKPVAVDKEQKGQESVNSGFRDDVGVKAVTEIDGVNVVTAITFKSVWTLALLKSAACFSQTSATPACLIRRELRRISVGS